MVVSGRVGVAGQLCGEGAGGVVGVEVEEGHV